MDVIRIVVVDDHPVVRHGLVAMLKYEPSIQVVGEAAEGAAAIEQIELLQPDVALLDLHMPIFNGVEVMNTLVARGTTTRFLVLTTYDADNYIAPALAAGAKGYLLKDSAPTDLIRAIQTVSRGGASIEPAIAARLLERMYQPERNDELSERERAVLQLLVAGASNKAIAASLQLSEHTIKSHLYRIFSKLGVQSRAEAVAQAFQRRLVEPNR